MGIEAIYPKRNLSKPYPGCKIYSYLLRQRKITGANEEWGADITYIGMRHGWLYLVAITNWMSRPQSMFFRSLQVDAHWDTWLYFHEGTFYLYYLISGTARVRVLEWRWDSLASLLAG